jgi:hypothetical protein
VWLTRSEVICNEDGDRNIGYRVWVEEQKVTKIIWDGEKPTS